MRTFLCAALFLGLTVAVQADDAAVQAVVDKAIAAAGGTANLSKYKGETFKAKGKFYGIGEGIEYTGEWAVSLPGRMRVKIEAPGLVMIRIVNEDKLWAVLNDMPMDVTDQEQIDEAKAGMRHNHLTTLLPLKDKANTLTLVGEAKVNDRAAVGLRVSHKGHRDVVLYFDKENHHLVKTETMAKGQDTGGQEVRQDTYYSNYKDVNGIRRAFKVEIKREGKIYLDSEVTEIKMHEKLEDAAFAKP